MALIIGTAGWAIPAQNRRSFPRAGSNLEKYATKLNGVEINSSFWREHRRSTYERWRDSVAEDFRFSVKLSREFTHFGRLKGSKAAFKKWFANVDGLGSKLGVLLIQTPGKLGFSKAQSARFFANLRSHYDGPVALEARNQEWASKAAESVLRRFQISRVIADPQKIEAGELFQHVAYFRLHGSPVIYKSKYTPRVLRDWAARVNRARKNGFEVWCIFDNTGMSHALSNALSVKRLTLGQPLSTRSTASKS